MLCYNEFEKGTYWRAFFLAKALVKMGNHLTIIATSKNNKFHLEEKEIDGVNIILMPDLLSGSLRSGWDFYNSIRRVIWLRSHKFDLLQGFDSRPTVFFSLLWARLHKKKIVLDWADWLGKGGSIEERKNPILKWALRPVETFFENEGRKLADSTTVICSTLKEKAISLGVDEKKIIILRNGADIENFFPINAAKIRATLDIPENSFLCGYVGTIFLRDSQLMAEVINKIHERDLSIYFLIAGYFPFDIKGLINHPDRMRIMGQGTKPVLNQYLNACDILWLPLSDSLANRGRLPLKATDYLAVGKPLLISDVGDLNYLFQFSQIGILSSPTSEGLAQGIFDLRRAGLAIKKFGINARFLAETECRWDKIAVQLHDSYKKLFL